MKKIFLPFCFLLIVGSLFAQSTPTGTAASYYKLFQKNMEKLKVTDYATAQGSYNAQLGQAKNNLANIKKYDPNYDASALEAEYNKYAKQAESAEGSSKMDADMKSLQAKIDAAEAADPMGLEYDGKISNAKSAMRFTKNKYPDQDLSAYENKIAQIEKRKLDAAMGQFNQENQGLEFTEKYNPIFDAEHVFNASSPSGLEKMKSDISAFEREINGFLSSPTAAQAPEFVKDPNADDAHASTIVVNARNKMRNFNANHFNGDFMKGATSEFEMEVAYLKLKARHSQAKGINQLFGQDKVIAQEWQAINGYMNAVPSLDALKSEAKKNNAEMVASRRMRASVDNDPALIAEFKNAFIQSKFSESNDIKAIHVTTSQWAIERDKIYNRDIIGRTRAAEIVVREADGKCYLYNFDMIEDYNGSSYGKGRTWFKYPVKHEMLCENVK